MVIKQTQAFASKSIFKWGNLPDGRLMRMTFEVGWPFPSSEHKQGQTLTCRFRKPSNVLSAFLLVYDSPVSKRSSIGFDAVTTCCQVGSGEPLRPDSREVCGSLKRLLQQQINAALFSRWRCENSPLCWCQGLFFPSYPRFDSSLTWKIGSEAELMWRSCWIIESFQTHVLIKNDNIYNIFFFPEFHSIKCWRQDSLNARCLTLVLFSVFFFFIVSWAWIHSVGTWWINISRTLYNIHNFPSGTQRNCSSANKNVLKRFLFAQTPQMSPEWDRRGTAPQFVKNDARVTGSKLSFLHTRIKDLNPTAGFLKAWTGMRS